MAVAAVVVIATAAAVAELLVRLLLRLKGRYYVWMPGKRLELHPDPATHPRLEPTVRFDINEDGERGPPLPDDREGLYRVLATGGSTAESFLLNHETSWPGVVERELSTPGALAALAARRVYVGTVARSGVGAAALDLIFSRILPNYSRLDLVIIMVGASDVLLWLESGATRVPQAALNDYFAWHPSGPFGWSPRKTALWRLMRLVRDRRATGIERRDNVAKWFGRARTMRARALEVRETVPDPSAMLDSFEANFRSALRRARAQANRVVVARQPWFEKESYTQEEQALFWNGGVGKAVNQEVTIYYSHRVLFQLMRAIDARAAAVCSELGVEQVELMPSLERSASTYYDHMHHTPVGAAAVGRLIAGQVLAGARTSRAPSATVANRNGVIADSAVTYASIEP